VTLTKEHFAREAGPKHENAGPGLVSVVELLFFAYRDFTGDPDNILQEFGFGRAHHRVLHFVDRYPGMRVADLLEILKITKQSLARVLKQLIDRGFIEQRASKADGRERLLHTTVLGHTLAVRLLEPQLRRISAAFAESGGDPSHPAVRDFLFSMIAVSDRAFVEDLIQRRLHRDGIGKTGG
jgi:DNA-binding MarR family transcriptional regulator